MKKSILRFSALGLLALAVAGAPIQLSAQTNEKPAAVKKQPAERKQGTIPFRGKLKAVDKTAKTITVGERTFQITSDTKIFKGDKPALLEDGVAGESVTGGYKKAEDGKLIATRITFSPNAEPKGASKKEAPKQ